MTYRRFLTAAAGATLLLAAGFAVQQLTAADSDDDDFATTLKQLQDKMLRLESRVAALEKKQDSVVALARERIVPYGPPPAPYGSNRSPAPQDWQPFEFNGMTFYIVPLGERQTPLRAPAK